jgi:hypothetical protein
MGALLRLLRSSGPQSVRDIVFTARPDALVASAQRHGLSAWVEATLKSAAVELTESADTLHRDALTIAAMALKNERLLVAAVDALGQRGVRPLVLKGPALAHRIYADALTRPCTDVDLWVPRSELRAAEDALLGMSLRPVRQPQHEPSELLHADEWVGPQGMVELHFIAVSAFGRAVGPDETFARAGDFELQGRQLRVLHPADELVYLAIHASHHMLQRLTWLLDLKLFLEANPALRSDDVVRAADAWDARTLVFYALDAAQRLVNANVPKTLLQELRPALPRAAMARAMFSGASVEHAWFARNKPLWFFAKAALADDPRALMRLITDRAKKVFTREVKVE